jgi:hypothetical protein
MLTCRLKGVVDCGDEAASWMTTFLGKKCRLVQQNPDDSRKSKQITQGWLFPIIIGINIPYFLEIHIY